MKRIVFLLTMLGLVVSFASAEQKQQPTQHKRTVTTTGAADRVPKEPGLPKHHSTYSPAATHAPKAGSMDSQLKELEKQNAKVATGPAEKRVAAPKVAAIKSSDSKGSKGSMNFGYQAPKSGAKAAQSAHASSKGTGHGHRGY
ncbi:MAG: hypothetical protein LAO03_13160 [Acidobacteriia bacterium]|nr:hypothetical protein [Terriglobia bacterium]